MESGCGMRLLRSERASLGERMWENETLNWGGWLWGLVGWEVSLFLEEGR